MASFFNLYFQRTVFSSTPQRPLVEFVTNTSCLPSRARFGGNKTNKTATGQQANRQPSPSPTSTPLTAPSQSSLNNLKSYASQSSLQPPEHASAHSDRNMSTDNVQSPTTPRKPPFYFREENSSLIVKGNFMTLATKPIHVEKGEWLAHQIVEQYRLLEGLLKVIQEVDQRTGAPLCSPQTCPQMMAANNTIYTWLDNQKNPIRIPASQYITLVQKWILGKINDPKNFPTDTSSIVASTTSGTTMATVGAPIPSGQTNLNSPLATLSGHDWVGKSSGFPLNFEHDIKNLYRQMFRCYAHMYYAHWLDPFYHLGLYKELNTCFIHFVNVGKQFDLLMDKDLTPMQPLVDIWLAKDLLPRPQGTSQTTSPTN